MRQRLARLLPATLIAGVLTLAPAASTVTPAHALQFSDLNKIQRRNLSGFLHAEMTGQQAVSTTAAQQLRQHARRVQPASNYFPSGTGRCPGHFGDNVKVNQNCLTLTDADLSGRAQANNETSIAQDPLHPSSIVASDNDYFRGDGSCGAAYSLNRGDNWNDSPAPMGFVRGTPTWGKPREYWQAGGDTSVAWDTKGNAYLSCQSFNRGTAVSPNPDQSSAFYVFRSTQNRGASWNFPGRPVFEFNDTAGSGAVLEDKQLMTVDNKVGSPFQDRVYVTWTEFAADGTAYIWEVHSNDYGEHFSNRVLVSSDSALCTNTFGVPTPLGRCNQNQFSQPFTGPDGALYVTWANFNNAVAFPEPDEGGDEGGGDGASSDAAPNAVPNDNHFQVLLAKSTDGGQTFSPPVKVGDYYDLPDCATYQAGKDPGRSCVPEKGATANSFFRAANYPVGAVNPKNRNQVVVTFASYINQHSNEANGCAPAGFSSSGNPLYAGVKTVGACNNDIVVSTSGDGGASFTGGTTDVRQLGTATTARGQATSDQWFQWATFTPDAKLAVSYYDRQYGNDEITGFSDFSLSGSRDLKRFGVRRVTSSSMPPPTQFDGTFWGDYTGLTALTTAFPAWSDTRNPALFLCPGSGTPGVPPALCQAPASNAAVANDQEIYTAEVRIPTP
jgi:hypothetical protein